MNQIQISFLLFLVTFLHGCGVPGPGGGGGSSNSDSSSEDFTVQETVSVIIENYTEDGLEEDQSLAPTRISIVGLDENFNERSNGNIPVYDVIKIGRRYEIQLSEKIVERLNIVVKVRLDSSEELYAPLHSTGSDSGSVTVNILSHYVMKKLYDNIADSNALDELLPCTSDTNCANQASVKALLFKSLTESIQAQEIFLDEGLTVNDAIDALDNISTLRNQVEAGVNEITRAQSPVKQGTARAISTNDGSIRSSLSIDKEFNSLFFGIGLSEYLPDDGLNELIYSTMTSEIIEADTNDNDFPIYPEFIQTTTLFEIRRDTLTLDIPFTREGLRIETGDSFNFFDDEPYNSLAMGNTSDSFLSTQSFLLNDRAPLQVIPGLPGDPKDIGWVIDPTFSRLYQVNDHEPEYSLDRVNEIEDTDFGDSPTWLISSNFSGGASYQLSYGAGDTELENPTRGTQEEHLNLFSWEIHGQKTTEDFSRSDINGKRFGVIEFTLNLNDPSDRLVVNAKTLHWEALSNEMNQTQPGRLTSQDQHYQSHQLIRAANNSASLSTTASSGTNRFGFYIEQTEEVTQEAPTGTSRHQGLMGLDKASTQFIGHVSQNARHLAYIVDSFNDGRGLIIANELRSTSARPVFAGETYQLLGNVMQMTATHNRLLGLTTATLVLNDRDSGDASEIDCRATLSVTLEGVRHRVSDNNVDTPSPQNVVDVESTACRLGNENTTGSENGGEIELSFENVFGQDLTLKGFVTDPGNNASSDNAAGNLINLLWIQDDTLGLVFAAVEQGLSPTFD